MLRIFAVIASTTLMILLSASPALAPVLNDQLPRAGFNEVFQDIVADYALYNSLLHDVYPYNDHQVSLHVIDPDSAAAYLRGGFSPALAAAMTGSYLQWLPEHNKMAVIATDSIPIITESDRQYLSIKRVSPDTMQIQRIYTDCYAPGDQYLYLITTIHQEGHWIVAYLQLDPL